MSNIENSAAPFLSVIVPTYNRAGLIGKTLKTLRDQTYRNYEIIIVDDGSTDNTEEVVKPFLDAHIRYVKKSNGERAVARNYGAAMAKGEYVNFFDSDDLALPEHLQEAARLIKSLNRPEWLHLAYAFATPENEIIRIVNKNQGATLNTIMCYGNPLSCNGVFIRKDIILSNRFNEDRALSASEDYELWCRLASRYPLYYSNTVTSWIIDHDMRSVRMNDDKLLLRLNLLVKYLQQDPEVLKYFGSKFGRIKMEAFSYVALHLHQPDYKKMSILYMVKALKAYPGFIFQKRFLATLRNILIKW